MIKFNIIQAWYKVYQLLQMWILPIASDGYALISNKNFTK
jgi:hypothetical protein